MCMDFPLLSFGSVLSQGLTMWCILACDLLLTTIVNTVGTCLPMHWQCRMCSILGSTRQPRAGHARGNVIPRDCHLAPESTDTKWTLPFLLSHGQRPLKSTKNYHWDCWTRRNVAEIARRWAAAATTVETTPLPLLSPSREQTHTQTLRSRESIAIYTKCPPTWYFMLPSPFDLAALQFSDSTQQSLALQANKTSSLHSTMFSVRERSSGSVLRICSNSACSPKPNVSVQVRDFSIASELVAALTLLLLRIQLDAARNSFVLRHRISRIYVAKTRGTIVWEVKYRNVYVHKLRPPVKWTKPAPAYGMTFSARCRWQQCCFHPCLRNFLTDGAGSRCDVANRFEFGARLRVAGGRWII